MKRALLTCALAFAMGCDIQPATTTPDTYTDFLKLSNQLTCEATLRCCGTPCNPSSDAGFYRASSRQVDYIAAGLMAYDRQAAQTCLAALQARYTSCDATVNQLPLTACSSVLVPKGPPGTSCESANSVCAADSTCQNPTCTTRQNASSSCTQNFAFCTTPSDVCCIACTGLGTCVPFSKVGQACTTGTGQPCAQGSYCNTAMSPFVCVQSGEQGQPCSTSIANSCNVKNGLVCLPNATCGTPQPDGATCTSNAHCTSGSCFLPNLPMATGGTCQPTPVPATVRQALCPIR